MQRKWKLWAAVQVSAQLPNDRAEALEILELAKELVDKYGDSQSIKRRTKSKGSPRGSFK